MPWLVKIPTCNAKRKVFPYTKHKRLSGKNHPQKHKKLLWLWYTTFFGRHSRIVYSGLTVFWVDIDMIDRPDLQKKLKASVYSKFTLCINLLNLSHMHKKVYKKRGNMVVHLQLKQKKFAFSFKFWLLNWRINLVSFRIFTFSRWNNWDLFDW